MQPVLINFLHKHKHKNKNTDCNNNNVKNKISIDKNTNTESSNTPIKKELDYNPFFLSFDFINISSIFISIK